jgi:hypothetical protein
LAQPGQQELMALWGRWARLVLMAKVLTKWLWILATQARFRSGLQALLAPKALPVQLGQLVRKARRVIPERRGQQGQDLSLA